MVTAFKEKVKKPCVYRVEGYHCKCLESGKKLFENSIRGTDKKIFENDGKNNPSQGSWLKKQTALCRP